LKSQPVHEQRSEEWYKFRGKMVTMSDFYKIFVTGLRNQLLSSKTEPKQPSGLGKACKHGIRYEKVVQMLYELRNETELEEFGCIQHEKYSMLGASPDGVNNSSNADLFCRLVEIKCPTTRKIIHGEVPEKYAIQIQGQLECLNLEDCDYIECLFGEYTDKDEFDSDGEGNYTQNGKEKGIIISCIDASNNMINYYAPFTRSVEDRDAWVNNQLDWIIDSQGITFQRIIYWKLVDEKYCFNSKKSRMVSVNTI
jgi:putative phage-type endonuclease